MEFGYQMFDGAYGMTIAQKVMAGNFNVNSLRNNTLLRKDEWQMLDSAIVQVARPRLRLVGDLMRRGMVKNLDAMRTTVLQWQTQSRTEGDNVFLSMDPQVEGRSERVKSGLESLPLPFFHADYQIGLRDLNVSRNGGQPLDTIMAQQKGIDIAENVENMFINGASSYAYGGGTIYGLVDHPKRLQQTLSVDWDDGSKTGALILADVLAMKQKLIGAKKYGPYSVYIPTAYDTVLDDDFKADGDKTIRERLLDVEGIQEIIVLDKLPANTVAMLQTTPDVMEVVNGMPLNNVMWETRGGMTQHFKIMTCMIPRIFVDQDDNTGVCILA